MGMLHVVCFEKVRVAQNYGCLCLVAANGDLAVRKVCNTGYGGGRSLWLSTRFASVT